MTNEKKEELITDSEYQELLNMLNKNNERKKHMGISPKFMEVSEGEYIEFKYFQKPEEQKDLGNIEKKEPVEFVNKQIENQKLERLKKIGKIIAYLGATGIITYGAIKFSMIYQEETKQGLKDYQEYVNKMQESGKEISKDTYIEYNSSKNEAEIRGQ